MTHHVIWTQKHYTNIGNITISHDIKPTSPNCGVNQLGRVVGMVEWEWLVQTHKPNIQTNKLQPSEIDQVMWEQLSTSVDLTSTAQHIPSWVPWNKTIPSTQRCEWPSRAANSCPRVVVKCLHDELIFSYLASQVQPPYPFGNLYLHASPLSSVYGFISPQVHSETWKSLLA